MDVIVLEERERLYRKPLTYFVEIGREFGPSLVAGALGFEPLEVAQYLDDRSGASSSRIEAGAWDFAHDGFARRGTRCRDTRAELIAPGGPDSNQQLTGPVIRG